MPANPLGNPRSERFQACLLGRKAPREIGGRLRPLGAGNPLCIGKYSRQKLFAAPIYGASNPVYIAAIRSDADDHRSSPRYSTDTLI